MKTKIIVFSLLIACTMINSSFISPKQTSVKEIEDEILQLINKHRNSMSKSNLEMNETMRVVARKHSQNMASGATAFGHDGFQARGSEIAKKEKYSSMAENVAYNYSGAAEAVDQWIKSSGHHKNMLGNYKRTGIGVAKKGQIFYFTQIFTD